ncbi:class I SAM-dependent methyltransferase [Streptomyces solincola]|uniref:Class I SAM-dependent methyltransferase n=1 Tax=Streptomyces solincola TaxID=2100817 RepID=A0A2S9PZV3_9ACTN|nr:class I SAM-dependent methyltransferase [Streptomyces solincola]PRH79954.1 class I SAM-dependent methyltransferase [Streptomyces solincola]
MTMTAAHDVQTQARQLAGYADASRLRQEHDRDWVLDRIPDAPAALVDLGSGIGQLLDTALDRFPTLTRAVGLERSPHRIAEARQRLARHGDRVALHPADLLRPPLLPLRADAVTMTSVLHWLHPDEERILAWVAEHLAPRGRFLLTTYHPDRDEDGFGGEDEIVRDALASLGVRSAGVPGLFRAGAVLPIGTRTRTADDLRRLLERHFTVVGTHERDAVVTVDSAERYTHFHAATFGDYYGRLVEPARRTDFYRAVGESAVRRQEQRGHVSSMPVRLWELGPADPSGRLL